MPKRKRRDQQHLNQQSARRRIYTVGGSAAGDGYKPGFPMNLLGNVKFFAGVGVVVAVIMVVSAILTTRNGNDQPATPPPTETPTIDPNATPSVSPTTTALAFAQADQVIDPANKEYRATVKTSMGDFVISLNADVAPNTVNSFVFLAQKGFFNNTPIHRVVTNFIAQMGDPTGTGSGGPGYTTAEEPNQTPNTRGTVSMAKSRGATTFGSQFFVNLKDNPALDYNNTSGDKFYPFGTVTSGMDVLDAIGKVQKTGPQGDQPVTPITITSVTIEESARTAPAATPATGN